MVLRSPVITPRLFLKNNRLIALFAVTFIVIFLVTPRGEASSQDGKAVAQGKHGPTMIMSYSKGKYVKNPVASFAYFIPLIATTRVDSISSANNKQRIGIISHQTTRDSKSFLVTCEFELSGSGFYMEKFDPAGMRAAYADEAKKCETMTKMLDYIRFEGDGFGVIKVRGTITGSKMIVTRVDIHFNAKGHKSPVTVGIYDIKPKDGRYKYENRSNKIVARVNTLSFKRTMAGTPRMGIKLASISDQEGSEGFICNVKGRIANFIIEPPRVDKFGNATMLAFGYALLQKKRTFTFPKAKKLRKSRIVRE